MAQDPIDSATETLARLIHVIGGVSDLKKAAHSRKGPRAGSTTPITPRVLALHRREEVLSGGPQRPSHRVCFES